MTQAYLEQLLRESGGYDTPEDYRPPAADRLFGWADRWFHAHVVRVVWNSHVTVKRGRFNLDRWAELSYAVFHAVEACGGRVHIRGSEHVRDLQGPAVIVANHMSLIETMLLPVQVLAHRPVTFVVKEGLLRYPVFGSIMRAVDPIAVGRANPREDLKAVLTEGPRRLEAGRSIIIFPQSTRSVAFHPAEFNSLGAKLARRAGVPVVPLALKTDFMVNGRLFKDLGPVDRRIPIHFRYGAPIDVGAREKEAHEQVVAFIRSNLTAWGGQVVEAP